MANNESVGSNTYESILRQSAKKKQSVFSFSKTYPAYLVLIIFLIISYFVWDFFTKQVAEERNEVFDKATSSVIARFEQEYDKCYTVLESQRMIYDLMPQIVRDYFVLYGSVPANTYSEIISLMYVNILEREKIPEFEFYVQSTGYFYYKVHPIEDQEILYPVQFMVPEIIPTPENNTEVIAGYDMGTNKTIRKAIEKARDSNMVVATPIMTVRDPDTAGFYMISPIFPKDSIIVTVEQRRELFDGMVFLEVDSYEFFEKALGDGVPTDTAVVFKVYEIDESNDHKLIYKSKNSEEYDEEYTPYLMDEQYFYIADRKITVRFATIPNFGGDFQSTLPTLSLVISLFLSLLLFGFVLSVTTSRARAEDLADRMTRSQRRIVDSSQDIIAVMSLDGVWKSMNPASRNLFGIEPENLIDNKIDSLFVNEKDKQEFYKIFDNYKDEYTERHVFQMKSDKDEFKWISWSFTVSKQDQLVYSIGRDVTLEKLAEQRELVRRKQIQLSNQHSLEESESKSYFMTKMSHQLRNDLTGIIGYLQLISNKVYDDEEEMISYAEMSEEASEQMLSFVSSDLLEVALGQGEGYKKLDETNFKDVFDKAIKKVRSEKEEALIIETDLMGESYKANVVVEDKILLDGLTALLKALSAGTEKIHMDINAEENHNEGATEIQILTDQNELVSKMIETYNQSVNNLAEYLDKDSHDIMLNLGIAASSCRIMHGNMKVETMGKDGNLVQITLPLTNPENLI